MGNSPIRATWADRREETLVAIRCYGEVLQRDPNRRIANYRMSRLLLALGRREAAEPFLVRSKQLQKLREISNKGSVFYESILI